MYANPISPDSPTKYPKSREIRLELSPKLPRPGDNVSSLAFCVGAASFA